MHDDPSLQPLDLSLAERHHREIRSGVKRWGLWAYDPNAHHLILTRPGAARDYGEDYDYWLNVGECHTEAGRLDWIAQIAEKNWPSEVVGDFVRALHDLIPLR